MRGVGAALLASMLLGGALVGCAVDGDIVAACDRVAEHHQECGFVDDGADCRETARYKLTSMEKEEVLCVLECHQSATCEDLVEDACAADWRDTPIYPCWEACASLSDFLLLASLPCPTAEE